jgi:hypothetical protein
MAQVVTLQQVANQTLQSQLGGQAVTMKVYQQVFGLYMDVLIGNQPIIQGVIALNGNLIVRNTYLGFVGDFIFVDAQPPVGGIGADPVYTGFGTRFFLIYLSTTDIAALNLPAGVS